MKIKVVTYPVSPNSAQRLRKYFLTTMNKGILVKFGILHLPVDTFRTIWFPSSSLGTRKQRGGEPKGEPLPPWMEPLACKNLKSLTEGKRVV